MIMSVRFKLSAILVAGVTVVVLALPVEADQPYSQAERQELQQQLDAIEQEIAGYEKELAATKTQKNTLTNKINQLKKQQASLQLQIKATNLKIASLENQLDETQDSIDEKTENIEYLKGELSKFVILVYQQDNLPLWYRVLGSGSVSEALGEVRQYTQVLEGLDRVLDQITQAKQELEIKQATLTEQQAEAQNLLSIRTLQQQKVGNSVTEQAVLLQETKGRESNYQTILNDAKRRAATIRNRIYQLLDVSTQITFGQAVQIAQWVSQATSIRPAFLLAVLTQESNLGKNVGTCNRLGDPPEKSWRSVMKPERDHEPFLTITQELGMDPDVTPVSCPMRDKNGKQIGWGGAMGPAQFIPSTWLGYKDRVSQLTGNSPANPWDIRDAFVAAAILLKGNGANGTRQGEWNAAMRYFSGSTNPRYRFYGDNVMTLAEAYEEDIEELSN